MHQLFHLLLLTIILIPFLRDLSEQTDRGGFMFTLQMVSWVTESWKFPPIFDAHKALFCGVFTIMLNTIARCLT